uniref:Ferritin n=1 Tax=Ostreococcus mediterraneus TaxID=1486918 RepID=A0A7S0PM10_9CHLO
MFITALCPTAHTAALGRASATMMKTTKSSSSSMAIRGARVRAHASSDVKKSEAIVEATSIYPVVADVDTSFARCGFTSACEEAMNRQINIEYNVSYIYHSMYAYFSRDNVALEGFAKHFEKESLEERAHAQQLMDYQNLRGGKVILQQLLPPQSEFDHPEKGCALYALELALSLEKLNLDKLRELYVVADDANDAALCDFLEGDMLAPQIASIREVAEMVATLKRMGPPGDGMAAWHFDQTLRA